MPKTDGLDHGSVHWPISSTSTKNTAYGGIEARISKCPRCEGEHVSVLFKPFYRRTASATHYGTCPATKEPLRLHQYVYSAFVD